MTVRYSKMFTVTGAISNEPVTIRIERIEAEGFRAIIIESLEGEYDSPEEFKKEADPKNGKIYNILSLRLTDTHQLADVLDEALVASAGA